LDSLLYFFSLLEDGGSVEVESKRVPEEMKKSRIVLAGPALMEAVSSAMYASKSALVKQIMSSQTLTCTRLRDGFKSKLIPVQNSLDLFL